MVSSTMLSSTFLLMNGLHSVDIEITWSLDINLVSKSHFTSQGLVIVLCSQALKPPVIDGKFDMKAYKNGTEWIKSILNVTAFSQNLSLLVTVIKDGADGHMFYYTLLIMLSIALVLQTTVALVIVWTSLKPSDEADHDEEYTMWFNRLLLTMTTLSLTLNIAVNLFFSARAGKLQVQAAAAVKSEL